LFFGEKDFRLERGIHYFGLHAVVQETKSAWRIPTFLELVD
jgi:hypothetical protein